MTMEGPVTIDQFLASLGADKVHSSGGFTISDQAAREKLGLYTLAHPSLYALELLSAAVLGGATRFEVTTPGGATRFVFDGQPVTIEECTQGLGHLFESSTRPRLSCLGLALSAARSLAAQDLTLVLPEGTFRFDGEKLVVSGAPGAEGRTEILVPGRFGFVGSLFRREASLRETLLLGAQAPLRLSLDGKSLSSAWQPEAYWSVASTFHLQCAAYPLTWNSSMTVKPSFSTSSPGDYSALIAMLPPQHSAKAGLTVVHHGVTYRVHDPELAAVPGFSALVMCGSLLNRNLSRSEIVWDESYRALVQQLKLQLEILVDHCMETSYRMRASLRQCRQTVEWARDQRRARDGTVDRRNAVWLDIEEDYGVRNNSQALADRARFYAARSLRLEAETLHLLALEKLLENFQQTSRQSRSLATNMEEWTALLRELLLPLKGDEREGSLLAFLDLLDPLRGAEPRAISHRILRHRLEGKLAQAASLLSEWKDKGLDLDHRVPAEVLLALSRSAEALSSILRVLGCPDVQAVLAKEWKRYRAQDLDLLADILEYREDPAALEVRAMVVEITGSEERRYLHALEMCRRTRGRGSFLDWIRQRARASILSASGPPGILKELETRLPLIAAILEGKTPLPEDLDQFLLPLYDMLVFDSTLLSYLLGRVAQRQRTAGEHARADRILARAYALRAMDRTLYAL